MSAVDRRLPAVSLPIDPMRALALLATLALIGAFAAVLYTLVDVAGDTGDFWLVLFGSLVAATLLARVLTVRTALVLAAGLLAVGLGWYVTSLSYTPRFQPILTSNVELLTGQSLHQIRRVGVWAIGVTPAPVFVTWYLALRREYGVAAVVGGAMLGYVVLTGDAPLVLTLLGVVAAAGMLGFGDLDRRSGTIAGAEHVAVILAVMVLTPLLVSVVPGGAGSPITFDRSGPATLESALLDDSTELTVSGEVDLSPDVRFTIESPVERYWKANTYDRYTGDGWVRTGTTVPLGETDLTFPPGPRRTVRQTVEVESRLTTVPAAWRPVEVGDDIAPRVRVTQPGDLTVGSALQSGDTYRVISAVESDWGRLIRTAGTDYPEEIYDQYTHLPDSTPDRIARRTAAITEDAETPYQTAVAIERWLEANRNYSLSVERPDGNVADAFLFEMEEGYCTYYATTMVVMLRSEGIPARLATGYTSGQQVDGNRWVVRGLDAHAWVEVYFDGLGWTSFDPTPAGPRQNREFTRIEQARSENVSTVDTEETRGRDPGATISEQDYVDPSRENPATNRTELPENVESLVGAGNPGDGDGGRGGGLPVPALPPREHVALTAVVLAGAVAGLRRTGVGRWVVRTAALAWQPRVDPETDVERAFQRVTIVLDRQHRPRRRGETIRQYLEAIDPPAPAWRVAQLRERARYGGEVDDNAADEAVRLVAELRDEYDTPNRKPRGPEW